MRQNYVYRARSSGPWGRRFPTCAMMKIYPEQFSEVFVTKPSQHLEGTVSLDRLLRADRNQVISEDYGSCERHLINVSMDQEELARQFDRYNMISAPVVDDDRAAGWCGDCR